DEMLRLELLYTSDTVALCKRRELGNVDTGTFYGTTNVYYLDIIYDVDRDEISYADLKQQNNIPYKDLGKQQNPLPLIREWEKGVLFIGCDHGNEPRNAEALLEVSKPLLRHTLIAHCVFEGWQIDDVRKISMPMEIMQDSNMDFDLELKDIYEFSTYIHSLIMPIVNPWGYDKDNRNNVQGVNINRNFPVLWKGLRDDANMQ